MLEAFQIFFTKIFDYAICFQLIVISVSTVIVFSKFSLTKKSIAIGCIKALIFFAISLMFDALLFAFSVNVSFFRGINFEITYFFSMLIFVVFFSQYNRKISFLYFCLMLSSTICVVLFGSLISMAINTSIDVGVFKICSYLMVLAFTIVVKKLDISSFRIAKGNYLFIVISSIACIISLLIVGWLQGHGQYQDLSTQSENSILMFVLTIYLVIVSAYCFTWYANKESQKALNLSMQLSKETFQKDLVTQSEENLIEMKKIRHELKNNFAYLSSLLKDNKIDESIVYLEKITGKFSPELFGRIDCGNNVINSVVNFEIAKALSNNIDFRQKIVVPHSLPFDIEDTYSLLANMIDNAFEYCLANDDVENVVELNIRTFNNNVFITVTNPLHEKDIESMSKVEHLKTTKENKNIHGFGIKIIKEICHKYEGEAIFKIEDGKFVALAVLKIKESNND